MHIQSLGVPIKVTEFQIKIAYEICGLANQFRYFWKGGTFSYSAGYKCFLNANLVVKMEEIYKKYTKSSEVFCQYCIIIVW